MITVRRVIRRKTFLAFIACAAIGVTASNTYAGFEWVPQKKADPVPTVAPVEEAVSLKTPAASAMKEPVPVDDVVLPMPMEAELSEPVVITPPPPKMTPEVTVEVTPTEETLIKEPPTRIAIVPKEAPDSGVVVNRPMVEEAPEPSLPPLTVTEAPEPEYDPEALKKPPVTMTTTRIILPEDAPQSAIEQTEKNNVAITAFPSEGELLETKDTPMPSTDNDIAVIPQNESFEFAEAVGFAKDVPLALALHQVVPADYPFSFGEGVNPGSRVSWNGGKPWNEVVADMVTPLGYSIIISGKSVRVTQQETSEAPSSVEPAAGSEEDPEVLPTLLLAAAETEDVNFVERTREIKRIGITDPGVEENDNQPTEDIVIELTPDVSKEDISAETIAAVAAAQEPSKKLTFWTAQAGSSLKETLMQWSESADAELVWDATHDFQLPADFEVQGSFEKAVDLLLKHGLGEQNQALSHSLAASTEDDGVQIIINNAA